MDGRRVFGTSNPTKEDGDLSRPGLCFAHLDVSDKASCQAMYLRVLINCCDAEFVFSFSADTDTENTFGLFARETSFDVIVDTGHFGWGQKMRCQKGSATEKCCDVL